MAMYSLVSDMQTSELSYAIVADDTTAAYVFPPGREVPGVDDARIARLARLRRPDAPPLNNAGAWLALAARNLGYMHVGRPTEAATLEDAKTAAVQALSAVL